MDINLKNKIYRLVSQYENISYDIDNKHYCKNRNYKFTDELIRRERNKLIKYIDNVDCICLDTAFIYGNMFMIKYLIKYHKFYPRLYHMNIAGSNGYLDIVKYFLPDNI